MTKKFIGTGVALVTPFDAKLNIDFQGLQKLLDHIANSKVSYLVVHGTTGEAITTTPEEKKAILSFVRAHNTNNLPIICGIGGNNTHEVINTIKKTSFQGIDAVLSASPYYNKPSQEGIYQHYKAIAEVCPVPILLYNVPSRTGANMTAATTLRLSKHPNIIGIKEASGDLLQCMEIAKGKHGDFLLISGDDMLTLPIMAVGAVGVISTVANGFPKTMNHMVDLALQGNGAAAQPHAWALLPIDRLIGQVGNPVGTKQLLSALGICKNYVRLPLVTAPASLAQKIQAAVLQEGIE
jgi:4-hydroxy-tetrahydrodipicolinate synthase